MGNAKSQQNNSSQYRATLAAARKRYEEACEQRIHRPSGIYPHSDKVAEGPIRFHTTHGINISIMDGDRVAARTNSFCYAIAFTSRPIKMLESVRIRLETVNKGWSGVMRFGFIGDDPSYMSTSTLPRYACPDLTNRPTCWAKAIPETFSQQGNILSFYFNYEGTVYFSVNDEPKGVFLEKIDPHIQLWAVFDVYGNTTSLRLLDEDESVVDSLPFTRPSRQRRTRPVSLPYDMQEQVVSKLSVTETLEPISFSATMGKQVKCRNRTHITRRDDILESSLAFISTALRAGETAYFYCAERKPNEIATVEDMGFGVGVTICNPSTIPVEELPFDAAMIMDRSEYWILFREFEPPPAFEFFALKIEKDGCLSYKREGKDKTILFHMDVSQPLYIVIDMCAKVSSLAIVGMSSESEVESPDFDLDLEMPSLNSIINDHSMFHHNLSSDILLLGHDLDTLNDTSMSTANTVPKDLASMTESRLNASRMTIFDDIMMPSHSQSHVNAGEHQEISDDAPTPSGIYPHEETTTPDVIPSLSASGASGAIASASGVSRSTVAAAVAAPIVGGLFWLGNRLVNSFSESEEAEPSIVVIESSSSSEDEESASDGSEEDAFFNAHDDSVSGNISSPVLRRGISDEDLPDFTRGDELLQGMENDLAEMVRELGLSRESTENSNETAQSAQSSLPTAEVEKQASTQKEEAKTSMDSDQEKNKNESEKECVVCCDNEVNTVVYTCGHACLCFDCGQIIKNQRHPTCPICRAHVKDVIRMYQ